MSSKKAIEVIDKIFEITQNTPEHNAGEEDQMKEARRLEEAISEINILCDFFIGSLKEDK